MEADYREGLKLLNDEKYEQAATVFRGIIDKEPQNIRAHTQLIHSYHKLGVLDEIEQFYDETFAKDTENPIYSYCKGDILHLKGEASEALEKHTQCSEKINNPLVYLSIGFDYQNLDKKLEALKALQQAIAIEPTYLPTYLALAITCYLFEEYDKFLEYVDEASKLKSADIEYQEMSDDVTHLSIGVNQYISGIQAINRENFEEAFTKLWKAVVQHPRNLMYNQALIYCCSEDIIKLDWAREFYQHLFRNEENAAFSFCLGQIAYYHGQYQEAIKCYDDCLRRKRTHPQVYLVHQNLGFVYLEIDNLEKAEECFREALNAGCKFPESYLACAKLYYDADNLLEASNIINQAMQLDKAFIQKYTENGEKKLEELSYYQALITLEQADIEQAHRQFDGLLNQYPEKALSHAAMGLVYLKTRDFKNARENYLKAFQKEGEVSQKLKGKHLDALVELVKQFPQDDELKYCCGVCYKSNQQHDEAMRMLEMTIQLVPDHAMAYCHLGDLHRQRNETELALMEYGRSLAIQPNLIYAVHGLADIYRSNNNIEALRALADKYPTYVYVLSMLETVLHNMDEWDEVLSILQRILELDENSFAIHYGVVGAIYQQLGHFDETIRSLERLLEFKPDEYMTLELLSKLYLELGQPQQALTHLQRRITMPPPKPVPYFLLGLSYNMLTAY